MLVRPAAMQARNVKPAIRAFVVRVISFDLPE
jgi:hypothetical protein